MMIDLHIHTTASDGVEPSRAGTLMAAKNGFDIISITDHDTCVGITELLNEEDACINDGLIMINGVAVLPGVEISCGGDKEIHILGLGVDVHDNGLEALFARMRESRAGRKVRIIEKLKSIGINIGDELPETSLNRPAMAAMLVSRGYAKDIGEAFRLYLGEGGKVFVDREKIPCIQAIKAIHKAGGIAVWAHPKEFLTGEGSVTGTILLEAMINDGLNGLECYHSECSSDTSDALRRIAARYDLLVTGGSDYHGAHKPGINLGSGLDWWRDMKECYSSLTKLIEIINR